MQFTGTLNQNTVLSTLYNMIISQQVFSKNILLKGTLADKFRVEGTLYGDTKLYLSTDVGTVYNFPDTTQTLLSKNPPVNPQQQGITISIFKQTAMTVDAVKIKQAFQSADIYDSFCSVVLEWLEDAYKVLNVTMINAFIGVQENTTPSGKNLQTVAIPTMPTDTITNRNQWYNLLGELVGKKIADICVDLKDVLRDYNGYGFLRSYDLGDFMIVWNKSYKNQITHVSLPMIFNKDDVIGKEMEQEVLNDRYFGSIITTAGTSTGVERTLADRVVTVSGNKVQLFAGDVIPTGQTYDANSAYNVDPTIICKIVHKEVLPFMSALKIQTEFYNPKDLDKNHYLTWGYNKLEYLKEYPVITIRQTTGS